jgi:hypothetical protein
MRAIHKTLVLAAAGALFASGAALAGDNSMTPFYGDSWADLQAHTTNMPQGPMQALQDRADAQAAWSRVRDNAHATAQRWRDEINRMWHTHDDHVPPAA